MNIKADTEGKILAWGTEVQGVEFTGDLPEDFDNTAGLGKYRFVEGVIVEEEEWTAPELPAEPDPNPEPQTEPDPEPQP